MFGHLPASSSNSARVILRHELPPNRSDIPTMIFLVAQSLLMLARSAALPVLTAAGDSPPALLWPAACVELALHAVNATVSSAVAATAAGRLRRCMELSRGRGVGTDGI